MIDYLEKTLQLFSYVTVCGRTGEDDKWEIRAYQILRLRARHILPDGFVPDDRDTFGGMYRIRAQPFSLHMQPDGDSWDMCPERLTCFVVEDPIEWDIVAAVGNNRRMLRVWTLSEEPSEVESCFCLVDGRPLPITAALDKPNCPTLCILDELHERGYQPRDKLVIHGQSASLVYDSRKLSSKTLYLQALLDFDKIRSIHGFTQMRSDCSQPYFKLLLRGYLPDPSNKSADALKNQLLVLDGKMPVIRKSKQKMLAVAPAPIPPAALIDDDIAGDVYEEEAGEAAPLVAPLQIADDLCEESCDSRGKGSHCSAEPSNRSCRSTSSPPASSPVPIPAVPVPVPAVPVLPVPVPVGAASDIFILGQRVSVESHGNEKGDVGYRVYCPVHHGLDEFPCRKYRSWTTWQEHFGHMAAEYYLATWLSKAGDMEHDKHYKWFPTLAQVRAYVDTLD